MFIGQVREDLPLVRLDLPGVASTVTIEFVVDTGFDGYFALSRSLVSQLDVYQVTSTMVRLADGSRRSQDTYEIAFDWFDEESIAEILEMEGKPLLGMRLLHDCRLTVEATEGGEVVIEPL